MMPSSLKRKGRGFLARTSRSSSPGAGRAQPLAFSVIFFRVSSAGIVTSFLSCSRRAPVLAAAPGKMVGDLRQAEAIEDTTGRHPPFAGLHHAPMGQVEFAGRMCIGVDAHHAAQIKRALMPAPVQ